MRVTRIDWFIFELGLGVFAGVLFNQEGRFVRGLGPRSVLKGYADPDPNPF